MGGDEARDDINGQMRFRSKKILLKNPKNASTGLMNGESPMISTATPFVLRLSKMNGGFFSRIEKVP